MALCIRTYHLAKLPGTLDSSMIQQNIFQFSCSDDILVEKQVRGCLRQFLEHLSRKKFLNYMQLYLKFIKVELKYNELNMKYNLGLLLPHAAVHAS